MKRKWSYLAGVTVVTAALILGVCVNTKAQRALFKGKTPAQLPAVQSGAGDFAARDALSVGYLVDRLEGGTISLQDLRGRYVLLDFWATWCKICEAQLPHLEAVWREFGHRNDFVLLGLCLGDDRAEISKVVARHQERWPQGMLAAGFSDAVAEQYGVTSLPHIVLIGPDGQVISDKLQDDAIESAVRAALGHDKL